MKRIFLHSRLLLLVVIAMAIMSSCIEDKALCPDLTDEEKGLFLRFHIATKVDAETRADEEIIEQEGSGAENYIALTTGTLRYLIFGSNRKFICDISTDAKTVNINDYYSLYEVTAKLTDKYFVDNLNGTLDFYILVLANVGSAPRYWGVELPQFEVGVTTLEEVFNNGLTMPGDVANGGLIQTSSLLSMVGTSSRIPMAGLQHFRFHGSMLLTASASMPYDISLATGKDINLLRALTKIEIIDKVNIKEGQIFDEIEDNNGFRLAETKNFMCGYMSEGSLLPVYSQWNDDTSLLNPETQQVNAPRIPGTAIYKSPISIDSQNLIDVDLSRESYARQFVKDDVATAARQDKCPVYSLYLFEYEKMPVAQVPVSQQPYFVISTKGDEDNDPLSFPVRMANYTNGSATATDNLNSLLRNHIYRFEISGIQQRLTVNWTVCPMDVAEANIEFN